MDGWVPLETSPMTPNDTQWKGEIKMEKLIEILEGIEEGVDYSNCTTLIDEHILDSLAIISLVAELEDEFDIVIPTVEIIPDNFNSAKAMWEMITRLHEE